MCRYVISFICKKIILEIRVSLSVFSIYFQYKNFVSIIGISAVKICHG